MIRINLFPEKETSRKEKIIRDLVIATLVIGTVIGTGVYVDLKMDKRISAMQSRIDSLNTRLKRLESVTNRVKEYKDQKRELITQIQSIKTLQISKSGPVKMLENLSDIMPKKLWLVSLREEADALLVMTGKAVSESIIADFLEMLKKSPFFQDVSIEQTQQDGTGRIKSFNIKCTVKYTTQT